VLAPDAPPLTEQQRRARIGALETLARSGRQSAPDDHLRTRVRLTRLERGPVRVSSPPPSERASRLAACTTKQLELLDTITRAGSVGDAAIELGTSRSTMYASLRRIAHRLQLRDSGELLRIIGAAYPAGRL
jgi:DNA-binding NarL/FixJ family response regulator